MKFIRKKRFWGLLLAVGLLVYLFYDFDFNDVLAALSILRIEYLIPLLFLEAFIVFIRTLRLKIILHPVKRIGVAQLYPVYCIGMMSNLLMPYLTGQVARLYLISKKTCLKKTFVFTTSVLEVLFDGMSLIGIVVLISLFVVLPSEFRAWHFIVLAGVIVAAMMLLFALSRFPGAIHNLVVRLTAQFPPALRKKIDDIKYSFFSGLKFLRSTKHMFAVSSLSLLSWVFQAVMVYLLIRAFQFSVSLWGAVIITAVVTIMMTIVLSPWNIGTFQGATVAAMQPFSINKPEALAFSFLLHVFVYLPPLVLGAIFSFKEGLSFKELRGEGKKGVDEIDVDDALTATGEIARAK